MGLVLVELKSCDFCNKDMENIVLIKLCKAITGAILTMLFGKDNADHR